MGSEKVGVIYRDDEHIVYTTYSWFSGLKLNYARLGEKYVFDPKDLPSESAHDTVALSAFKVVVWRFMAFFFTIAAAYFWTKSWGESIGIALFANIAKTAGHFAFERIWIWWRKRKA